MPEEGGQVEQALVWIDALAVPAQQPAYSERVPQIVEPWRGHTGSLLQGQVGQEGVEGLADRHRIDRLARGEAEQRGIGRGRSGEARRQIALQALADVRSERHQAILRELGLTDDQDAPDTVQVAYLEPGDFANAQAKTIQQRKDRLVGQPAVRAAGSVGKLPRDIE